MKIALGCDHGGYELKEFIITVLDKLGYEHEDFGCYSTESCDYPDFGAAAARAVAEGKCDRGIVICTTGIGISIAAKNQGHPLRPLRRLPAGRDDPPPQRCQHDGHWRGLYREEYGRAHGRGVPQNGV